MFKQIRIAGNPLESYKIVYGENLSAAQELRGYLEKAAGIALPLIPDTETWEHEIRVGKTSRVCRLLQYDGLGKEGFVIKTAGGNLILRGSTPEGDLNAVYEFLHRYVGFRFLHKDVEYLKEGDAEIPEGLRYKHIPPYEYRKLDWVCTHYADDWKRKNHENSGDFHWVGFVHTLSGLSEMNDPGSQPCLSDPKVLETVIKNVKKTLDDNPACRILSVSQNDNQNYCKCPKCAAVDEEEGSHAGSLLRFVNAVADAIKDDYPEVSVETLAYQYTRKAPRITKPRDNVIVRLCSIECCFSHELNDPDCEVNAAFKRDIIEWGKISKRLYIWDYVTDFSYYIPPFPNFRVLLGNMKFFADNHVAGMYPEGNYNSVSGEFGELRAYLLGRAEWDPCMSTEEFRALAEDFLRGYYGAGWKGVAKFLQFVDSRSADHHFNIWAHPFDIVPREEYEAHEQEIESWWNEAEALAGDAATLDRVQKSRLTWTAVKLFLHPDAAEGEAFYDALQKYEIKWNEWRPFRDKADIDFSKPPVEWLR